MHSTQYKLHVLSETRFTALGHFFSRFHDKLKIGNPKTLTNTDVLGV